MDPSIISSKGVLIGQYDGGIFSVEVPSSQMTLACVKLTKNKNKQKQNKTKHKTKQTNKKKDLHGREDETTISRLFWQSLGLKLRFSRSGLPKSLFLP